MSAPNAESRGQEEKVPYKQIITSVYVFPNGMCMTVDQFGRQIPEYQGKTSVCEKLIRDAGFTKPFKTATWKWEWNE